LRAAFSTGTALLELNALSPESSESGGVGNDRAEWGSTSTSTILFSLDLRIVRVGEVVNLFSVGIEDGGGMLREIWFSFGGGNGAEGDLFGYPSEGEV